jgi:hypothetical protein
MIRRRNVSSLLTLLSPERLMKKSISNDALAAWDRCYDFLNIVAEKFCEKIGVLDSKQS